MDSYYIVLDTETTNSLDDPIAYDIGFAVINADGKVIEAHSYVVAETFLDEELMSSAYFIEKIPHYWEEIANGKRELRRLYTIRKRLAEVCSIYGINKIIAHNARFDYRSCNLTQRIITCSKWRYFFPYEVEIWDSLKMARECFGKDEDYIKFCKENDFMVNHRPRLTAEILYRYLTNNLEFEEAHTGLEDVMIEKEIFCECLRRNPHINGRLWE